MHLGSSSSWIKTVLQQGVRRALQQEGPFQSIRQNTMASGSRSLSPARSREDWWSDALQNFRLRTTYNLFRHWRTEALIRINKRNRPDPEWWMDAARQFQYPRVWPWARKVFDAWALYTVHRQFICSFPPGYRLVLGTNGPMGQGHPRYYTPHFNSGGCQCSQLLRSKVPARPHGIQDNCFLKLLLL